MTDAEIQALLQSGDPADIDKAIAYMDANKEDVNAESSSGTSPSTQTTADTTKTDVNTDPSSVGVDAVKGVQSKNGEHILPYQVLEQARHEAQEAKRQLEELRQKEADAPTKSEQVEAMQRQIELMQSQLEKAGIKPAQLDQSLTFTEEELEALDEYGELGGVSKKAARKVAMLEAQVQELIQQIQTQAAKPMAAAVTDDPITEAIASVDGLTEVMRNPDLAAKAVAIDDTLKDDPVWSKKPLNERFGEVMRRLTPTLLRRDSEKQAKQEFDPDRIDPPHSLNGISASQSDASEGLENIFKGLSETEIHAKYQSLSPAQQAQVNEMLGW